MAKDERDDLDEGSESKGNGKDASGFNVRLVDMDETGDDPTRSNEDDPVSTAVPSDVAKQLAELKREKDELYDRLLRKHADFENFRKRVEKEKREFQVYALSELMLELVQILDNFERALSHSDEQSGVEYRKGVELIYRQFRDILEKRGLKPIDTEGQSFDPNFHEAILREERNDLPENTILGELQKGYFFREKLLRPAMVKVSYRTEHDPEIEIVDTE